MARVKSEAVRAAILTSAASEIAARGYLATTVGHIARGAKTAPSNVYVYFTSKLDIYLEIYDTWLRSKLVSLEQAVMRLPTADDRIKRLVQGLFHDVALDKDGYTAALVEALAAAQPGEQFRPGSLKGAEERLTAIIRRATGFTIRENERLYTFVRLLMITFDGVALRGHLSGKTPGFDADLSRVEAMLISIIDGEIRSTHA